MRLTRYAKKRTYISWWNSSPSIYRSDGSAKDVLVGDDQCEVPWIEQADRSASEHVASLSYAVGQPPEWGETWNDIRIKAWSDLAKCQTIKGMSDCRSCEWRYVCKRCRYELGRSQHLGVEVVTVAYKRNRNCSWSVEKSEMPIVMMISETTQLWRSEGALL